MPCFVLISRGTRFEWACLTLRKRGLLVNTIPRTGSDFQGTECSDCRAVTERARVYAQGGQEGFKKKAESEGLGHTWATSVSGLQLWTAVRQAQSN